MPTTETLLILANSEKKGGRCVAGKRLRLRPDNFYDTGGWIRPIHPNTEEGKIPTSFTQFTNGPLAPLDIVEISFVGAANDANHPEDWIIQAEVPWKRTNSVEAQHIPALCDAPGDLWGGEAHLTERVPIGYVPAMQHPSTLLLVQPESACHVSGFMKPGWEGRPARPRTILSIPHKGVTHEFSIRDTAFLERYNVEPQIRQTGHFNMRFDDPKKVVFCLSLTPPFKYYHYKIAAAIIELP